jgi:hypothetical protein
MPIIYDELGNVISSTPNEEKNGGNSNTQAGSGNNAAGPTTATNQGTSGTQNATNNTGDNVNSSNAGSTSLPGARPTNPLAQFSSYAYQLSWYMISPEAFNAYVEGGRKDINELKTAGGTSGVFLLAQNGGINNDGPIKRANGFDLDYSIDNLKLISQVATTMTATTTNITDISFDIHEPYGFSLPTKLRRAYQHMIPDSEINKKGANYNSLRQFFVLGIRFQGYDKDGNIADSSKYFNNSTKIVNSDGVFETLYPIMITELKFKLNGTATTYHIKAKIAPVQAAMTTARATVDNNIEIKADTVENALTFEAGGGRGGMVSLFGTLNFNEEKAAKARKDKDGNPGIPNVYKVRYIGDTALFRSANFNSPADTDKKKQSMSSASKQSQVNDHTAVKTVSDPIIRKITIDRGTSTLQAINNIVKKSSYLEDALRLVNNSVESPSTETSSPESTVTPGATSNTLRWYNVTPEVKVKGWDGSINDYAYEITYVIQPYDTPAATTPYGKVSKYTGPHKRYDYWFTGKNTEITGYSQSFDLTYFLTGNPPDGNPASDQGNATVPNYDNKRTGQDTTGKIGDGNETQNSYMTSLYDPNAYTDVKIDILGDPDYLMTEAAPSANEPYNQYYSNENYTINPNGGQVFIEVNFNEGVDYDNQTGLLKINESILFYDFGYAVPENINGVCYFVERVDSSFSKGKFSQQLKCRIMTFPRAADDNAQSASNIDPANQTAATAQRTGVNLNSQGRGNTGPDQSVQATPSSGASTSTNSGFTPDKAVTNSNQYSPPAPPVIPVNTQEQSSVPTSNATNPIVSSGENVANTGSTQAGKANLINQGGREEPPNP